MLSSDESERTDYLVRRLAGNDVAAMREMLQMFAVAFVDAASYRDRSPSDAYLRAFLERPDAYLRAFLERPDAIPVAAFVREEVVGGLVAYVLQKFEQERSEIYIYDLAVAQEWRRRGIATALIAELRRIAAEIGAYVIFVQADLGDDAAIALYQSLGTREAVLHFDIQI